MALEPAGTASERESGETVRPAQVPTGSFEVDVKLVHGAKPGPEIAGSNGHGTDGDEDGGEDVLRMGPDGPGLYSSDECVFGIAAANRGEAEAFLEGSGLSVRDRDDYLDGLPDGFCVEEADDGKNADGDDGVVGQVYCSPIDLHDDLMGHVDAVDAIPDLSSEEAAALREDGLEVDDEIDGDDEDAISAGHDADPSLEDELQLRIGPEDEEPDDLADAFGQRVERVLAMQDGRRYGTDI